MTRKPGDPLDPAEAAALDEAIKRKPVTGLTDAQIAQEHGVSRQTVVKRRQALKAKTAPAANQVQARKAASRSESLEDMLLHLQGGDEDEGGERLREMLASLPILTPDELMRALSALISSTKDQRTKVSAIKLLDDLSSKHRPVETAGPSAPLTDDEKVERLVRLFQPLPRDLVERAFRQVWPDAEFTIGVPPMETPDGVPARTEEVS